MKTVVINGSPRKNANTAKLLKEAAKGAEAAGDSVEYIDLYDLRFTGCRSCFACKFSRIEDHCKCYWPDELSPLLERCWAADRIIMGSPIYYGEPTGVLRSFLERLAFPIMSYNDYSSLLPGKVDVEIFLTMNAPLEWYGKMYEEKMKDYFSMLRFLKGNLRITPCCDTLQVDDYSQYELKSFSEEHKRKVHEEVFPKDLEKAYDIGARK